MEFSFAIAERRPCLACCSTDNRGGATMTLLFARAMLASLAALTVVGGSVPAAATPVPSQGPIISFGMERRQPPQGCGPENDGETVVWDGWLWKCEVVLGAVPPWQWKPLWRV
jgi:hypothetical protein